MSNQATREMLLQLSKEELVDLIEIYAKNCLAVDGVWFQAIEKDLGMDTAMLHDEHVWERMTRIEANRVKQFLGLEEHPGLEGLEKALRFRFHANFNEIEIEREGNKLIYTNRRCRVQDARTRKNMPLHPCKPVGIAENKGFGSVIDDRITCKCLSCYPEITDPTCGCKWEYTLNE